MLCKSLQCTDSKSTIVIPSSQPLSIADFFVTTGNSDTILALPRTYLLTPISVVHDYFVAI